MMMTLRTSAFGLGVVDTGILISSKRGANWLRLLQRIVLGRNSPGPVRVMASVQGYAPLGCALCPTSLGGRVERRLRCKRRAIGAADNGSHPDIARLCGRSENHSRCSVERGLEPSGCRGAAALAGDDRCDVTPQCRRSGSLDRRAEVARYVGTEARTV